MKIKNILFIVGLLTAILFGSCNKPNAEDILIKSSKKCQSIDNGYYEFTQHMKFMTNIDTIESNYKCHFKKLNVDTIYSSQFHYQVFRKGKYPRGVLYTGDNFANYTEKDSTGKIMLKSLWAEDIISFSHSSKFYSPILDRKNYPLPNDSSFVDTKQVFEFLGEEVISDVYCYKIKMSIIPENDSIEAMKPIRTEYNYWISKQDYLPMQYSIAYDIVMNNDTMSQFESNHLKKHDFNNLKDTKQLELSSIPQYIKLKDYIPSKRPELLPLGSIAPNWSLVSLDDKTIRLSDFRGQIVLIDFFYKSCYPCMLALPDLQDLHEKYGDKGLAIIGIDPIDTKEKDDIENFLGKRGVTYTVLLGGEDVAVDYNVSGYPTMYMLDKDGNTIYSEIGYGEGVKEELEAIIENYLF